MYNVLIADDDRNFVEVLSGKIDEEPDYQTVAKVYDGRSAIEQLELLRPEIVILDIIMPESDGVYVVDHIRTKISDYNPTIYILSGISTNNIIKTLNALEIDFFSMKPVAVEVVMQNLNTAVEKHAESRAYGPGMMYAREPISDKVKSVAMQLGAPPHRLSTRCMNEALIFYIENPDGFQTLTKVLYPEIARRYGLTSSAVERNIRNAIDVIQKAKTPLYGKIFAYADNKRITNGEFLAVMSEYLGRYAVN